MITNGRRPMDTRTRKGISKVAYRKSKRGEKMNDIMNIEIIEVSPAVVKFNKSEIIAMAEETALKYNGLVFTDETVKDGKKTVAELRKIVKNINDFKVSTKKELTASVTEFENDCKEIMAKFDESINFISTQCDLFEVKRKEQKTADIKVLIDNLYEQYEIEPQRRVFEIRDEWLNATKSIKDIESGIAFDCVNIKAVQDKRNNDVKSVEMFVKLQNHESSLSVELSSENYVRMLDYKQVEEVEESIKRDAESNKQKELEFAARIEREAQEKAQKEIALAELKAQQEVERVQESAKAQIAEIVEVVEQLTTPVTATTTRIITQTLEIKATKEQWYALSEFMDRNNIKRSKVV